jgi:hypothetical protein
MPGTSTQGTKGQPSTADETRDSSQAGSRKTAEQLLKRSLHNALVQPAIVSDSDSDDTIPAPTEEEIELRMAAARARRELSKGSVSKQSKQSK